MNKDIRVSVTLPTHPKTIKLMKSLGDRSFYNLIRLWTFIAQAKPDGDLSSMDADDIEIAADWNGEAGIFVEALLKLRFLEKENDVFIIHDWDEHNEYVTKADERSEKARNAARKRWEPKETDLIIRDDAKPCSEHMLTNAVASSSLCPSLLSSSLLLSSPRDEKEGDTVVSLVIATANDDPCPHKEIINIFHETLPQLQKIKTWNGQCQKNLKARWREDKARQNLEWWRDFFIYISDSDFLMGRKKDWQADLMWIVCPRNFTKIINGTYENRGPNTGSKRTDGNIRTVASWAERKKKEMEANEQQ